MRAWLAIALGVRDPNKDQVCVDAKSKERCAVKNSQIGCY